MVKDASPTNNTCVNVNIKRKRILLGLTVGEKRYKTRYTKGWKKQWRWRCQFRDAYYVARLFWPYAHVKMEGLQKIIDHYGDPIIINNNVVDLNKYKEAMSLE
jgi:hypothetical protein